MIPSSRGSYSLILAVASIIILLLGRALFYEATAFQPAAVHHVVHQKHHYKTNKLSIPLRAAKKKNEISNTGDGDGDDEAIISDVIPSTTATRKMLLAKRKQTEAEGASSKSSSKLSIMNDYKQSKTKRFDDYYAYTARSKDDDANGRRDNSYLIDLKKKIDQKIMRNNWNRTGQRRPRVNDNTFLQSSSSSGSITPGQLLPEVHVQHETDSMQSLLGYNHFEGEWSDRNSTTYHVAIVFGKGLIQDQISIEYASRIRTLVKLLKEEEGFRPKLICFTGGNKNSDEVMQGAPTDVVTSSSISDASAGYVYFRHLCASQGIPFDHLQTNVWVDKRNGNERETMERVASELWRKYIKTLATKGKSNTYEYDNQPNRHPFPWVHDIDKIVLMMMMINNSASYSRAFR